jgi:hypothetical protein
MFFETAERRVACGLKVKEEHHLFFENIDVIKILKLKLTN